ncbi:hypothetical protein AB0J72_26280 [Dactylosporangium sp. NPDC049742]|uniref:hypothetical protein n=1 Tax=Dactylosporangium sp. NPDC049742 TaxID=3154737 RepID=UPI0034367D42
MAEKKVDIDAIRGVPKKFEAADGPAAYLRNAAQKLEDTKVGAVTCCEEAETRQETGEPEVQIRKRLAAPRPCPPTRPRSVNAL